MSTIVTRAGKGAPLTHTEVDANFTNLNTDKLEVGAAFNAAVAATPAVTANTAKVTNATHTGDVTGSGALTIAADAVTNAKLANMATQTFKGRTTAGTGDPEDMSVAQAKALLNLTGTNSGDQTITLTGDVTGSGSGSFAATVANDAVTNAKLANVATATIKGRTAAGTGDPEDLTGAQATTLLDTFTSALKGLVPASGGGTTNFLRADGTWAAPGGGGGGSPGGSSGEIQFNDAGAFAGAANVEIEGGNLKLMTTTDPAAPTGGIALYAANFAGRLLPKIIGPAGIDTALQAGLHGNSVILISPTSGTAAPSIIGGTLSTAATMSLQFTAGSTNRWSSTQRKRFQTSTTAGNASGMRLAYAHVHRGNAAGFGGFFFRAQLGCQINLTGGQKFVGLAASTGALAGEPSALLNMCGMGYDAVDSSAGNWQFMRNDGAGAAVKVDLGADAARGTTQGWDLIMFMRPNSNELFVRIVNLNTNALVLDTSYTTDVPAANAGMNFKAEVRNGAVAAADNLEVSKVYIETDY